MLGASLFFNSNASDLGGFYDLYHALKTEPVLGATMGAIISTLFAVALLASGQNSTITGTLATNCNGRIFKITHTKLVKTFNYTFPCCHSCYRMLNHF